MDCAFRHTPDAASGEDGFGALTHRQQMQRHLARTGWVTNPLSPLR
jgi:hypothetical protein